MCVVLHSVYHPCAASSCGLLLGRIRQLLRRSVAGLSTTLNMLVTICTKLLSAEVEVCARSIRDVVTARIKENSRYTNDGANDFHLQYMLLLLVGN